MRDGISSDLVPMTAGDLVDESFDLYKRNFALFAGVVAVVQVPSQILLNAVRQYVDLDRVFGDSSATGSVFGDTLVAMRVLAILTAALSVSLLLYMVQSAALTAAISERVLGAPSGIWRSYRSTWRRWLPLALTWAGVGVIAACSSIGILFVFGIGMAMLAATAGDAAASSSAVSAAVGVSALVAMVVASSFLLVMLGAFLTQVVVIEKRGYIGAISRNWQLVRGQSLQTWGAIVLIFAIVGVVMLSVLLTGSEAVVYLAARSFHVTQLWENVMDGLAASAASLLVQPLFTVFLTLLYYDRRVRREGFDVAVLERQIEAARAQAADS